VLTETMIVNVLCWAAVFAVLATFVAVLVWPLVAGRVACAGAGGAPWGSAVP
jgi:hypothetical protein